VPLLSVNVFYAYYYQSMKLALKSFLVSFSRGLLFPCIFIFTLPLIRFDCIFLSVSLSDLIVFACVLTMETAGKRKNALPKKL
jgi:Na+-driven multidrug efflux pump